ncbi:hypothetical protein MMC10_010432 [Thelotrema lepadinum]|nr:hypothetical protein [Thelotrema lepadinum]
MSNDNSSTLKSYVDSATGAIQSAVGSLTGNAGDQNKGEARQDKAALENDLSHSVGKVGPFAVSGSGGVSKDSSDRTEGSWNQTVGSAKESIGNFVGADGLKREGIEQKREGKGQEAKGQLSDLGSGIGDRVTGTLGGAVAGLTGNRENQQKFQDKHDDGKTAQRSAEADIQKQAP